MSVISEKACSKCGEIKSLDGFHNSINTNDGKAASCKVCILAKNRAWKQNNPEKSKQSKRNYALYNGEKIRLAQAKMRRTDKYQQGMREYRRRWRLAKRYGISMEEYQSLIEACKSCCEICGHQLSTDHRESHLACVDHDHSTGKVRGILCRKCNQSLGTFGDSIQGLQRAMDYLVRTTSTSFRPEPSGEQMPVEPVMT